MLICIISVLSNETNTLSLVLLRLLALVSMYMKQVPIGGRDVAPDCDVGEFVFVLLRKSDGEPSPNLLLQIIFQFCRRSVPVLGKNNFVVSIICVLLYICRLYAVILI